MSTPARLALTGGGYRAGLLLDLVRRLPDLFEVVGVLARSDATARSVAARGLPVHRDLDGLLRSAPDLVVVSVPATAAVRSRQGRARRSRHWADGRLCWWYGDWRSRPADQRGNRQRPVRLGRTCDGRPAAEPGRRVSASVRLVPT